MTDEETEKEYLALCRKRAEPIPLQHLTHRADFMGYEFYVDGRVLVPRQDTEILAEEALKILKDMDDPDILDMCTGSGCLVLSLLMEIPGARGPARMFPLRRLTLRGRTRCGWAWTTGLSLWKAIFFPENIFDKK